MKHFPLIWAGLWRKRARTVLTMLSIIVTFLLFGLLEGINAGFDAAVSTARLNRLITQPSGRTPLPLAYLAQIEAIPGVRRVSFMAGPLIANIDQPLNATVAFAVDPARWFDVYGEIRVDPAALDTFLDTRNGLLAGIGRARRAAWQSGSEITLNAQVPKLDGSTAWSFQMIGTYESPEQRTFETGALIHFDYFDEARAANKGMVTQYQTLIDDPNQAAAISIAITIYSPIRRPRPGPPPSRRRSATCLRGSAISISW